MTNTRDMEELKALLLNEVFDIGMSGNLTKANIEELGNLVDIVKDLYKICMMDKESSDSGYSNGIYPNRRYYSGDDSSNYSNNHDGGYSNGRGDYYVRGHYSRNDRGYNGGYSNAESREMMVGKLKDMMDSVTDQNERNILQHAYDQLAKK